MIEFTGEQEKRAMQRDCRVWTELMVEAWYLSGYPRVDEYPAEILISHLKKIFFFCKERNLVDTENMVLLTFILLRTNLLRCTATDTDLIVKYFLEQAKLNNVDNAKNWIDLYLEEMMCHGS